MADDVHTEDGAVRLVRDDLAEPPGLAPDQRPAVAAKRHDPGGHLVSGGLRLGIAEPHRSDLWRAVGRASDQAGIERVRIAPGDRLDGEHTLVERLVGKLETADNVPDGADARLAGAEHRVDGDHPTLDGDARALDADVLDIGRPAHCDEQDLGLEALLLAVLTRDGHRDAALIALDRAEVEAVAGQTRDAPSLELAPEFGADGDILERDQARQHLDDGHLGATAAIQRSELDAHRSGAEHDRRGGNPVDEERLVAGEDAGAVGRDARQLFWPRARGEDHRARLELDGVATRRRDRQMARAIEAATPDDRADLVLAQQELHALVQLADHLIAPAPRDRVVEMDVAGGDPEGIRVAQLVEQRRTLQQRLGRDAAAVQAGTADLVLLHQHHAQPKLGRADRRRVAAHPAPENGDVKSFGHGP